MSKKTIEVEYIDTGFNLHFCKGEPPEMCHDNETMGLKIEFQTTRKIGLDLFDFLQEQVGDFGKIKLTFEVINEDG